MCFEQADFCLEVYLSRLQEKVSVWAVVWAFDLEDSCSLCGLYDLVSDKDSIAHLSISSFTDCPRLWDSSH